MAVMPILKYPDPRLREKSRAVTVFDEDLKALAADLGETMLAAPGAGLAAPQVGELCRMIVIAGAENGEDFDDRVIVLVNPEIVSAEGEQVYNEGCLSVEDFNEPVVRAGEVAVRARDVEGRPFELQAEGRRAVILQHEIDHLDGILVIDHLSRLKRDIYQRKLRKSRKEAADD
jgi:peptide deformylase